MLGSCTVSCGTCFDTFEIRYKVRIDAVTSPEQKEKLLSGGMNRYVCPHCSSETVIVTPFAYWSDQWVAIVHAIRPGDCMDIDQLVEQTRWFLTETRPKRENLPTQVRIMGGTDQLIYMLKNPEEVRSCPFSDIARPNWDTHQNILEELVAVYLKEGHFDLAFMVFLDFVNNLPELCRIKKFRDNFQLISEAADEHWLAAAKTKPTPIEIFEQLCKAIDNMEDDSYNFGDFKVVWCTPGPSLESESSSDHYLSYLVPSMFVYPVTPSHYKQALACLLLLLHSNVLQKRDLGQGWLATQHEIIYHELISEWKQLTGIEQQQLRDLYSRITGSDLTVDLQLINC